MIRKNNLPFLLSFSLAMSTSLLFGQSFTKKVAFVKAIKEVSSVSDESVSIVNANGTTLYFMRTYLGKVKHTGSGQEIWTSERITDSWAKPERYDQKAIKNDNANNAVIGASENEKRIYLFNSTHTRNKLARGLSYIELDENGEYGSPIAVNIPGFEVGEGFYSFYVTPDEQQFFVSAALDSTGYEDLFVSEKQLDGSWGELINLGPSINTASIETTPFLSKDKQTLYFSSDGHPGLGSADIFMATRMGEGWSNWTTPKNLGAPINSDAFEASFTLVNEEAAIFSSTRNKKCSDIYEVFFVQENEVIQLLASNDSNLLKGTIALPPLDTIIPLSLAVKDTNGNVVDTIYTDEKGNFTYNTLGSQGLTVALIEDGDFEMSILDLHEPLVETDAKIELPASVDSNFLAGTIVQAPSATGVVEPIALAVKDATGAVIDTIYTNDNGEYKYNTLGKQGLFVAMIEEAITAADSVPENVTADETVIAENTPAEETKAPEEGQEKWSLSEKETPEINIYFDFDSYAISASEKQKMDAFIADLNQKPGSVVYLTGHTDAFGTNAYNQVLAERRAKAVKEYFISKGAAVDFIVASKGASEAVASNATAKGRKLNRRVTTSMMVNQGEKDVVAKESIELIVNFDFDAYVITETAKQKIDAFIAHLDQNVVSALRLTGHTDAYGTNGYNQVLSERRAKSVKEYFISKGITVGLLLDYKGETEAAATNATVQGRKINRRVTVVVAR